MKNLAKTFKALSDETRLRILALLTHGELCVCDLKAVLQLPQSTVSRHLAYLRNTGLVADRREGIWMYYRLEDQLQIMDVKSSQSLLPLILEQQHVENDLTELYQYLEQKDTAACG